MALPLLGCGHVAGAEGEKGDLTPYPAVTPAQLDSAHAPARRALLVGIDRFDDSHFRPLRYAARDARDLGAALLDPALGSFDSVEVLTDESATHREGVQAAFSRLEKAIVHPLDTVVVYLSTHGTLAKDATGDLRSFLVARDTRIRQVTETGWSMADVRRRFARLPSRRKVLVLATCHSGQGKSRWPLDVEKEMAGIKGRTPWREALLWRSEASIVLSACTFGETAREDEKLEHDIYTHFLIGAIKARLDPNGDGATTVSEAHEAAMAQTFEFTHGRQRPTAVSDILGVDPLVLAGEKVRAGRPALVGYGREWEGVRVQVDGTEKGTLPGSVVLDPGSHQVTLSHGSAATPFLVSTISLGEGERLDLSSLTARRRRPAIGVRVGGLGFLDPARREDLYGSTPALGLSVQWPDLPWGGWETTATASVGQLRTRLSPAEIPLEAEQRTVVAGASCRRLWRTGRFSVAAGPALDAIQLQRELEGPHGYRAEDGLFSWGVGAGCDLRWDLGDGFEASVEGRLTWVHTRIDEALVSLGHGALLGGLQYRLGEP